MSSRLWLSGWCSGCLAVAWLAPVSNAAPRVPAATPSSSARQAPVSGAVQLKVRRLPDSVELLIEGTGISPQLQQSSDGAGWQGQLSTAAPSALKLGPQRLSLPEVGLQSISFDGGGNSFSIGVTPMPGVTLSRPVVSADGQNLIIAFPSPVPQASLQVNRVNLARPGAVPLPSYAPPLQPRAVAPPLGDMAVGTMTLRNPGYVNVSGPSVTMTLKNAPARDALMALAQLGGYGFAYVDEPLAAAGQNPAGVNPGARPLSISFRGESYARALNTTLLAAGLQGKLEGNMIFAGPNALSKSFGAQVSKVYRLNQVGPNAAADYLANLGASVTKTNTITTSVTQGVSQGEAIASAPNSQTTQASSVSTGPLIGLRATTDTRLGTITMVGDPAIVGIAEQYLRQLDLRQRQVALNVKLLDVSLENDAAIDNSFAFRFGNNFIVNNSGQLLGAFGNRLPPDETSFRRDIPEDLELTIEDGRVTVTNLPPGVDISGDRSLVSFGRNTNLSRNQIRRIERQTGSTIQEVTDPVTGQSSFVAIPNGSNSDAIERTITRILGRNAGVARVTATGINRATRGNPGSGYDDNTFFDFVRAQITSGSTKLLASPTLILQENAAELRGSGVTLGGTDRPGGLDEYSPDSPIGRRRANEGVVRVGTNVVTNYQVTTPEGGGNIVCDPEVSTAGLVLGARVEKIDDNGFVTFSLSPSVSAITGQEQAPEGCGSNLNILSVRRLDTGAVRVRDGQTLILTGVISDFDRSVVSKWPILGDIPLIGQFFRNTSNQKEKRELVIMVTPRIINDEQGGAYGYGYQPGTRQVRDFLGTSSF